MATTNSITFLELVSSDEYEYWNATISVSIGILDKIYVWQVENCSVLCFTPCLNDNLRSTNDVVNGGSCAAAENPVSITVIRQDAVFHLNML
ncbi:MAG: hypothetical protein ACLSCV_03135 [Acutalibacteraceae bacterium]